MYTVTDDWSNPVNPDENTVFKLYGIRSFDVQYWNGSAWMTIPNGSIYMTFTNMIFGVVSGGVSTSIVLAITGYLIGLYVPSKGGNFISFSNPEIIGMIFGLLFGAITGGILGAVITGFTLNLPQAITFGFLLNLILCVFLIFYTGEDPYHNNQLGYLLISLIISGVITGMFVSFIQTSFFKSE